MKLIYQHFKKHNFSILYQSTQLYSITNLFIVLFLLIKKNIYKNLLQLHISIIIKKFFICFWRHFQPQRNSLQQIHLSKNLENTFLCNKNQQYLCLLQEKEPLIKQFKKSFNIQEILFLISSTKSSIYLFTYT